MITAPTIKYTGPTPKIMKNEMNKVMRGAYKELAEFYHKTMFMDRFTFAGGKALDFQDRTRVYNRRKREEKGHNDFLVWSGKSRELAKVTEYDSTSTNNGEKVKGFFPVRTPGLNRRRSDRAPRMNKEVTRLSKRHAVKLVDKLGNDILPRRFGALNDRTVKT